MLKKDFMDPTNHQIVGYCGIEKAIILIYAFYSTVFYATSKSTSHFCRIMRQARRIIRQRRIKCDASNRISLDVAFTSNKIGALTATN